MKTRVEEIDTNIYELKSTNTTLKKSVGLSPDIIKEISKEKEEPEWVLDLRLKALDYFNKLESIFARLFLFSVVISLNLKTPNLYLLVSL